MPIVARFPAPVATLLQKLSSNDLCVQLSKLSLRLTLHTAHI